MSGRKARVMGLGMVATAGAGFLSLAAMMNSGYAHADDIGLVIGGSGLPIPGPDYVVAADTQFLNNQDMLHPLYPDLSFYQATSTDPTDIGFYGNGVFTPEGLFPLGSAGVNQLLLNYPTDANGFPDISSSVGQGMAIVESTIAAEQTAKDIPVVF